MLRERSKTPPGSDGDRSLQKVVDAARNKQNSNCEKGILEGTATKLFADNWPNMSLGAGGGNRTRVISLEVSCANSNESFNYNSIIEAHYPFCR